MLYDQLRRTDLIDWIRLNVLWYDILDSSVERRFNAQQIHQALSYRSACYFHH